MEVHSPTDFAQCPDFIGGIAAGYFQVNSAGAVVITGLGFQPTNVIFLSCEVSASTTAWSACIDNGGAMHHGIQFDQVTGRLSNCTFGFNVRFGANQLYGSISSLDPDGFTVTANVTGSGNLRVHYLAFH